MIGNKSRVFKVIKTPVDDQKADGLPAHMKDLLGFEFFAYKDGAPLELDPDYGPEYSQLYKQKVAVLAQDIAQLLKTLQTEGQARAMTRKVGASRRRRTSRWCILPNAATTESPRGSCSKGSSSVSATLSSRIGDCRRMKRSMSRRWRRCSRAARSRSISWARTTAPSPMVRPASRSAYSRMSWRLHGAEAAASSG